MLTVIHLDKLALRLELIGKLQRGPGPLVSPVELWMDSQGDFNKRSLGMAFARLLSVLSEG